MRFISRDTAVRPIAREWLFDGGQLRGDHFRQLGAIEADHRDIPGTRSPARAIARSAPAARESETANTASGFVLRQQLLHRPFTGRRAKILRVGHLLIRQTVHVQHAFIAALAQTGIAIAEVVINERDAAAAAIGQSGHRP